MGAPYRAGDVHPESTTLRRSWWSFAMCVLATGFTGGLAYVLFRYVAAGWFGYAIAGVVGLFALLGARDLFAVKVGTCPRCGARVETSHAPEGYLCSGCPTFLAVDRDQLVAMRDDRISDRLWYGVVYSDALVLPDHCCVCLGAAVRHEATSVGDVPYCAEHAKGLSVDPKRRMVRFRSPGYAARVAEQSRGRLEGIVRPETRDDSRWLWLVLGAVMAGSAAAAYWGLAALEREGYEIVPTGPKGLVMWLLLKLLGRLWVTTVLVVLAAGFFGLFVGSFKPTGKR